MLLNGKTAVITGGTRGIGYAVATKYLEPGSARKRKRPLPPWLP